jgi:hypothetical protein
MNRQDAKVVKKKQERIKRAKELSGKFSVILCSFVVCSLSFLGVLGVLAVHLVRGS